MEQDIVPEDPVRKGQEDIKEQEWEKNVSFSPSLS